MKENAVSSVKMSETEEIIKSEFTAFSRYELLLLGD